MTPNAYAHLENATLHIDVEHEKKLQRPANSAERVLQLCYLGAMLVAHQNFVQESAHDYRQYSQARWRRHHDNSL